MRQLLTLAFVVMSLSASAAVTMTAGTAASRTTYPRSLSGITYAGGDTFYAVADDNGAEGGLYKYTIKLSEDGKSVVSQSISTNNVIKLPNTYDLEGVAFDPASGNVWAADETRETIKEYDPKTGVVVSELEVPAIIKNYNVGNYGMESLTISGDGLTMWTANEEALTCDGDRASPTSTTTVRLVKFVRKTVHDKFVLTAMYPYTTDKLLHETCSSCRHGVADMVALPDDSLLVVERDYSKWGTLPDDFAYSIYRVTAADLAAATEIKDIPSLKTATWTAVRKTKVVEDINLKFVNYEGLCLGPRLANGDISLVLVSDAGDGNTNSKILPFVMKGLNIWTVDVAKPSTGVSSPVGSNYRILNGKTMTASLSGPTIDPQAYTNDGATVTAASWRTSGGASGTGSVASFIVNQDETLTWTTTDAVASTGLLDRDSFEQYAAGTSEPGNWTGDCEVQALTYTPPAVGYPMGRETHEKVLDIDGEAIRSISTFADGDKLDFMLMTQRPAESLEPLDNVRTAVAMTSEGQLAVWTRVGEDCAWTPMDKTVYPDGQWIRVTIMIKGVLASVFIDGAKMGDYHLASEGSVSELVLTGTKADDFMVTTAEYVTEGIVFAEETESDDPGKDGIPFAWLDQLGWPRDPDLAAANVKVPGYSLKDLYLSGVDPQGTVPLKIKSMSVGSDGKIHLEINGYRGNDGEGYAIRYATTIEGLFKARSSEAADGKFDGDPSTHTTIWNGTLKSGDASSGFYRVEAR